MSVKKEVHNYTIKFSLWIDDISVDRELNLLDEKDKEVIISYAVNELIAQERHIGKYLKPEIIERSQKQNINFNKPNIK
jgi:hypothetical protein